jgi:hypothetical protein
MPLNIIEIISRSEQGTTRPFLCRAENEALFYVKGSYAGKRALCCEWVAGRLGHLLELPIPDFCIAEVPAVLVNESSRTDAADLGSGLVFASQLVEDAQEITFADVARIDLGLKQKVLLFDWWIRNEDRTLTEFGGNPNLLRTAGGGALRVFDLNLAFDETFDEARFWRLHVFNEAVAAWPDEFKAELTGAMRTTTQQLPAIWSELPEDWRQAGGLDLAAVERLLNRFENSPDRFWAIPR